MTMLVTMIIIRKNQSGAQSNLRIVAANSHNLAGVLDGCCGGGRHGAYENSVHIV